MPKRTIEIPERLTAFGEAMEKALRDIERFEELGTSARFQGDRMAYVEASIILIRPGNLA